MDRHLLLEQEGCEEKKNPAWNDVQAALRNLDPQRRSFVILTDQTGSYVQTAGTRLRLTIEYRKATPVSFQHYVLGAPGREAREISINYSGGAIKVRVKEVLSISKALEVFKCFYDLGAIPEEYELRSITQMFAKE